MKLSRVAPVVAASLVTAAVALASSPASAQSKSSECIDANSVAQDARASGHFERARNALKECMAVTCPKRIRDDCTERWEELQKAQPTVILSAKDASGADLDSVSVTLDGHPLASKLDGVGIRVDAGAHEFVFTSVGSAPVTMRVVVKEGEHARPIAAVILPAVAPSTDIPVTRGGLSLPPAPEASATPIPGPVAPASESHGNTLQTVGLVGAGVGVVALGIGTVFGVLAIGSKNTENSHCGKAIGAPSDNLCDAQGYAASSSLSSRATLSTAFIIGGAVVGAGGVALYFAAPKAPHVEVGVGSVSLSGTF